MLRRGRKSEIACLRTGNQEPHILGFVPLGENDVYINVPNMFATPEVQAEAHKMATSWPIEKIQSQLLKAFISISTFRVLMLLVLYALLTLIFSQAVYLRHAMDGC